jgi:hypothetical protein
MVNLSQQKRLAASVAGVGKRKSESQKVLPGRHVCWRHGSVVGMPMSLTSVGGVPGDLSLPAEGYGRDEGAPALRL